MTVALDRKGMTPHKARWLWPLALLLAGALQAFALALPWSGQPQWWLQVLALSVLCAALQQSRSSRQAAWWGGLFATAWLSATFWWLFISMHTYGGLPAVLAVLAVLALAAFLGSYYALLMALWRRWARPGWQAVGLFAACWTLGELARGTLWTGFPWGRLATPMWMGRCLRCLAGWACMAPVR